MKQNQFIKEVQQALLYRCRGMQPITAEFLMSEIDGDTTIYLEESNVLLSSNQEIGMLMLDELGINPCSYENVEVLFDLNVFAGTILNGDSENGVFLEWFTIEVDEDGDGDKYLRCMYRRCRNVEEV